MVAVVLEFPSQGSVLASVNWLSGSHIPFAEIVVPIQFVLAVLVVPLSESEELTGPRVIFRLNVGATEREVSEEVGFEVLASSLTGSAIDELIHRVIPTEGATTNTKKQGNIT